MNTHRYLVLAGMLFLVLLVACTTTVPANAGQGQAAGGTGPVPARLDVTGPSSGSPYDTASNVSANSGRQNELTATEKKAIAEDASGRYWNAFAGYCDTYRVLQGSLTAKDADFQRVLGKASHLLETFQIEKGDAQPKATLRAPFATDFSVVVKDLSGKGVASAPVSASWTEFDADGNGKTVSVKGATGLDGVYGVRPSAPTIVGTGHLTIALDTGTLLPPKSQISAQTNKVFSDFVAAVASKSIVFDYQVDSQAKRFTTAVLVYDVDERGNMSSQNLTQSSIVQELSASGIKVPRLPFGPIFLAGKSTNDILSSLKYTIGTRSHRFVFGSIKILDHQVVDGKTLVNVAANISVADVDGPSIIYTVKRTGSGKGEKLAEALADAWETTGKTIGGQLVRELP